MISRIAAAIFVLIIFCAGYAFARNINAAGLETGKSAAKSPAVSLGDLAGSKEQIMNKYFASIQDLIFSLEKTTEAFGVKNTAIAPRIQEIKSLQKNNISEAGLVLVRKAAEEILAVIRPKVQKTVEISVPSKNSLVQGIDILANRMQKIKDLLPLVQKLITDSKNALTSASLQDKPEIQEILGSALALANSIPLELKSNREMLLPLVEYASEYALPFIPLANVLVKTR